MMITNWFIIHTYIYTYKFIQRQKSLQRIWGAGTGWLDWKKWNFRWRLKVDKVSIERMCAGREFQVKGADTEKAGEEKLLVIPGGRVRRLVLEKRKDLDGR